MKLLKSLMFLIVLGLCIKSANAQAITAILVYENPTIGLGCGCNPDGRTPFADGTVSWCLFWDRTANGADESDELIPVGTDPGYADFSCQAFNGNAFFGVPGNFLSDPAVNIPNAPEAPDQPVYFVKASGSSCCWVSDTFRLAIGLQDVVLTDDMWTCENVACPIGDEPDPVTNVEVSDGLSCTEVTVSWNHTGEGITGFILFLWDSESDEWVFQAQLADTFRSRRMPVCADGEVQVGVQAVNGSAAADIVAGVGRTFLRHFDPANEFDLAGSELTMHFVRPPQGDLCLARLYFDLYSGGAFVQRICEVTDPDMLDISTLTCTLPAAVPNPSCMVVMHDSSTSDAVGRCGLTDTISFEYSTDADDDPLLAREFALEQNYPNPFNPATSIQFTVPTDGVVELAIFNLIGERVATLVSGSVNAGVHNVSWNAADVPSGMYFYRLVMGNQIQTRKMLLLK